MQIKYHQTFSLKNKLMFNLTESAPNHLTLKFSDFSLGGHSAVLNNEWDYDVPVDPPTHLHIAGFLVKENKPDGAYQVLIDEAYLDGIDFKFEGSPYVLVARLFMLNVLPGQKTLNDCTAEVFLVTQKAQVKKEKADAPGIKN